MPARMIADTRGTKAANARRRRRARPMPLTRDAIAALFGVPAPLLGDYVLPGTAPR